MNIEKEREAFETFAQNQKWNIFRFPKSMMHDNDGQYVDEFVNGAWIGWVESKKLSAEKLEGCVVVPEWISTKEALPDEGVEVLVHRYGQVVQATRDSKYAGGFKERNCYGWQATYDVTYWMPKNFKLPDSYSFYYNDEHPYRETMLEAARGGK